MADYVGALFSFIVCFQLLRKGNPNPLFDLLTFGTITIGTGNVLLIEDETGASFILLRSVSSYQQKQ